MSPTPDEHQPKPLTSRLSMALDYLAALKTDYDRRSRLPTDNPWREGAIDTARQLGTAIGELTRILTLVRAHPLPSETELIAPGEQLLWDAHHSYAAAYSDLRNLYDEHGRHLPYSAERDRSCHITRLIANTIRRCLYTEDLL